MHNLQVIFLNSTNCDSQYLVVGKMTNLIIQSSLLRRGVGCRLSLELRPIHLTTPHKPTKERLHRLWRTIRYFYGITSILSPNVKKRAVKTALNSTCYEYTRPKALSWSPQGLETNLVCSPSSSRPTPRMSSVCQRYNRPSRPQAYT